jgi:indole-3-glycerol phosphate synthase
VSLDLLDRIVARKRWEHERVRDAMAGWSRVPPETPFLPAEDVLRRAKAYLARGGCDPREEAFPGDALVSPRRAFETALRRDGVAVIAELKRRSPSRGVIATWTEPEPLAERFTEAGADAVSCLTEAEFFDGRPGFLPRVRRVFPGPVLRKDFLLDELDLAVSAALGADAVLLIAAVLGPALPGLRRLAGAYALETLVEVHDVREVDLAMAGGAPVVGVNHRDLRTFRIDLERSARLFPLLPSVLRVAESGLKTADDVRAMARAGAHAVLIGEGLAQDPGQIEAMRRVQAPPEPEAVRSEGGLWLASPEDVAVLLPPPPGKR